MSLQVRNVHRKLTAAEQAGADLETARAEVEEAASGTDDSKKQVAALKEALRIQQVCQVLAA